MHASDEHTAQLTSNAQTLEIKASCTGMHSTTVKDPNHTPGRDNEIDIQRTTSESVLDECSTRTQLTGTHLTQTQFP